MIVTVKFFTTLRDITGKKDPIEVELEDGAAIAQLLDKLCLDSAIKKALLDENQVLKSDITILRNGREIRFLEGAATELSPGDEISIFPLVAGG
jgi:molybdopterin synthase sulfur carrier subunit